MDCTLWYVLILVKISFGYKISKAHGCFFMFYFIYFIIFLKFLWFIQKKCLLSLIFRYQFSPAQEKLPCENYMQVWYVLDKIFTHNWWIIVLYRHCHNYLDSAAGSIVARYSCWCMIQNVCWLT